MIQLALGNNSLGWPSPIQNNASITRFAFSYLSKDKATIIYIHRIYTQDPK